MVFASAGEEVIHLLQQGELSQTKIVEVTGVPMHIVNKLAQVYRSKEQRRSFAGTRKVRRVTKEWLIEHRINQQMTLQEIANILGVTRERVRQYLKREGLTVRIDTTQSYWRKTSGELTQVNKEYFDSIDSESKAYWLGYMMAKAYTWDGDRNSGRKEVVMNIARKNLEHAQLLLNTIGAHAEIKERHQVIDGQQFLNYHTSIRSHYLAEVLEKYNIMSPKHIRAKTPDSIKLSMVKHFYRGYFDGKGFLWRHPEDDRIMMIMFGSRQLLREFRQHMIDVLGVEIGKAIYKDSDHNYHRFYVGNKDTIKRIWHYLYDDATVYLPRKIEQYKQAFGE